MGAATRSLRRGDPRLCLNPRCGERLRTREFPLCWSCRMAGGYGALAAGVIGLALKWFGVI